MRNFGFPHTRGGGPSTVEAQVQPLLVFPTRVGVDLQLAQPAERRNRFPHTRGGGPPPTKKTNRCSAFSPHAWGWTVLYKYDNAQSTSFSPHAWGWTGNRSRDALVRRRFPHTRGGGPKMAAVTSPISGVFPTRVGVDLPPSANRAGCHSFSPHAWGWTCSRGRLSRLTCVFPTRVGVDRPTRLTRQIPSCFPHTRGGGPGKGVP